MDGADVELHFFFFFQFPRTERETEKLENV
jgi:hypothetical protein